MKNQLLTGLMVAVALMGAGCSTTRDLEREQAAQQITIYTSMESTALVYSDPGGTATLNDHPLRWIGFVAYPGALAMDYAIDRPLYTLAWLWPGLFGFTPEDAMVDTMRPSAFAKRPVK